MKILCLIGLLLLMGCSEGPVDESMLLEFNCPAIVEIPDKMVSNKLSKDARVVTYRMNKSDFTHFRSKLDRCGYSEWSPGGISYGHVDEGWGNQENLIYSEKRNNGILYLIAYNFNEKSLHLVKFPCFE